MVHFLRLLQQRLFVEEPGGDYWALSREPLTGLVFTAPILAVYELGVLTFGAQAVRNGADLWLRRFLEILDFGQYFLLPLLTVAILLGWHHTTGRPWRVARGVLSGMAVECVLLAICLCAILQVEKLVWNTFLVRPAVVADLSGSVSGMIGFLGAGVYEELLFRLILLSLAAWVLRSAGATALVSVILAAMLTSVTFAMAHYVGPYGELVLWRDVGFWFGFLFRVIAGLFFSALYVWRGFGIAVGAHAGYDILVTLLYLCLRSPTAS